MADIVIELSTIANERYGKDIRMPIHSALDKINQELESKKEGGRNGRNNSRATNNSD